jgi:uncharacterized surface protein with fasciclin (FAS1) repeats
MRLIAILTLLLATAPAHATWKKAPRPSASVAETARSDARLGTLMRVLSAAGLEDLLDGSGAVTLYAPSDAAFDALPPGTLDALMLDENRDRLRDLLRYHVDDRRLRRRDLPEGVIRVKTLLGESRICVARSVAGLTVTDANGGTARTIEADIRGADGVIHVIDRLLIPGGIPDCTALTG